MSCSNGYDSRFKQNARCPGFELRIPDEPNRFIQVNEIFY